MAALLEEDGFERAVEIADVGGTEGPPHPTPAFKPVPPALKLVMVKVV